MVQKINSNIGRHADVYFCRPALDAFLFNRTQNAGAGGFHRPCNSFAVAIGTGLIIAFPKSRMHPLPGQFQQAEHAHFTDLNTRAIFFQSLFHSLFNRMIIGRFVHINKINDNQTGQVTQPELAGNFVAGFQIGLQGCFFQVFFFGS